MTVKKGDLVKLKTKGVRHEDTGIPMTWDFGLVIKGPYEEQVTIMAKPFPVTVIELVCDVVSDDKIYKAIPVDRLSRHQQKLPDASL